MDNARLLKLLSTPLALTPEQEQQLAPGNFASILPPRELVNVGWTCAMAFLRKRIEVEIGSG